MSNIRSIPTTAKIGTSDKVALIETKLAMLTMHPVAVGWQNHATLTMEQRLADYAWRLGYLTRGIEELSRRMQITEDSRSPSPSPAPTADAKEPDHA